MPSLRVLKFGGTSVGSVDRLRCVAEIVKRTSQTSRVVVVASALGGVTDRLVAAFDGNAGAESTAVLIRELDLRHRKVAGELLSRKARADYEVALCKKLDILREALSTARVDGRTPQSEGRLSGLRDEVLATGERFRCPSWQACCEREGLLPTRSMLPLSSGRTRRTGKQGSIYR